VSDAGPGHLSGAMHDIRIRLYPKHLISGSRGVREEHAVPASDIKQCTGAAASDPLNRLQNQRVIVHSGRRKPPCTSRLIDWAGGGDAWNAWIQCR
jgi:hypothetical protein